MVDSILLVDGVCIGWRGLGVMILDACLEHKYKVGYLMVTGGDKNLC
jgi:hypothetical protein